MTKFKNLFHNPYFLFPLVSLTLMTIALMLKCYTSMEKVTYVVTCPTGVYGIFSYQTQTGIFKRKTVKRIINVPKPDKTESNVNKNFMVIEVKFFKPFKARFRIHACSANTTIQIRHHYSTVQRIDVLDGGNFLNDLSVEYNIMGTRHCFEYDADADSIEVIKDLPIVVNYGG